MTAECARWSARPWRRRCQSLECCRQRTGRRFAAGVPADARGRVRYEDLMRVLRGEMSEVRRQCIRAAFQKIDYNRNGALDKKDLQLFFNAAYHPKVQAGELTEAAALERLLVVKEADGQPRLPRAAWGELVGPLLQNLFQALKASKTENEYLMKAVMRVIASGQELAAPFVPHILPMLASILTQVAGNPRHPVFNHYLFESLSGLARVSPVASIEPTVFPIFTTILTSDTQEFMPYVFQIFAQLLEQHPQAPPQYLQLLPPLLAPALYEHKGNIPGLVRLVRVFLEKSPQQVVAGGHLQAVLGVFQFLVQSKLHDHEGFNLLNAIVQYFPREQLGETLGMLMNVLLSRLMANRTTKFVKCLLVFFSLFVVRFGADALVETVEKLQPGASLWKQVYANVWLRDVQKVSGKQPRKMCVVALTRLAVESQHMFSDAMFNDLWPQTVVAIVKMLELGEEQDAEGLEGFAQRQNVLSVEQLREQEQGYTNAYCPLQAAQRSETDPCAEIADERAFVAQTLPRAISGPHGPRCRAALQAMPPDVKSRLQPLVPSAF
eukprot:TRINITY_DN9637_c0_g1_i4.p1 TRINITY_DN9637_c0_g1~~TRINITY_DN9637_c0_g1_i4.p1  ORF type:complete len:551 (+),score=145.97 TRINITY_DN9637_c0_g1_i4:131-1783(+)